jgi:hypothetical protein
MTLAVAQFAFAVAPSRIVRAVLGATFVVPAGLAGYYIVLGMVQLGVPSLLWREIFACLGATFVAVTTWKRITAFTDPRPIEPGRAVRNQPRPAFTGLRARHLPSPRRRHFRPIFALIGHVERWFGETATFRSNTESLPSRSAHFATGEWAPVRT